MYTSVITATTVNLLVQIIYGRSYTIRGGGGVVVKVLCSEKIICQKTSGIQIFYFSLSLENSLYIVSSYKTKILSRLIHGVMSYTYKDSTSIFGMIVRHCGIFAPKVKSLCFAVFPSFASAFSRFCRSFLAKTNVYSAMSLLLNRNSSMEDIVSFLNDNNFSNLVNVFKGELKTFASDFVCYF